MLDLQQAEGNLSQMARHVSLLRDLKDWFDGRSEEHFFSRAGLFILNPPVPYYIVFRPWELDICFTSIYSAGSVNNMNKICTTLWFYSVQEPLRKHTYSNILKISPPQTESFQIKILIFFHISAQNIDCGYSLEPPRGGGSNEYPQSMFLSRNKNNNVYPCKPQFYYIKVGFKGVKII